ncbi:MAG: alkaline phosphatase family protein [Anaerolineales bacterium]|nr:alkaline phosphatase family protein [Anaerolineales bacterium]
MRSLIIGIDSFDPYLFETFSAQGKLSNLKRLAEGGGYSPLRVSSPPQTEVSWTSIATGADPGTHGIFDFVHRHPDTYLPYVSILPTRTGRMGAQFIPPYTARTLFEEAVDQGYPSTALWWPAMFPARPELPVHSIPGLGTPDIRGQLGLGAEYAAGDVPDKPGRKTPIESLNGSRNTFKGILKGPLVKRKEGLGPAPAEFQLELLNVDNARLTIGKQTVELRLGQWSPYLEIQFKADWMVNVHAVTRAILTAADPVRLYFLPLQIHPLHALWRHGTPKSFVKETWEACGPFLSLGWPQDTTGLEDGCISDEQFLALCEDIFAARECILMHHLGKFKEGVLASIFDDLDRIQHMFRRDRAEVVAAWYQKLDEFIGRVNTKLESLGGETVQLLVMSDHGFSDFDYKFNVNTWLVRNGYLAVRSGTEERSLSSVDWARSKAYAVGLNSLYLNLKDREGQGSVPVEQVEILASEIRDSLDKEKGPDGKAVFERIMLRHEAFSGPLLRYGPDLVLGYAPGYRASSETGLGKWEGEVYIQNKDHWGADHCISADAVPGVLFASSGLTDFPNPSFRDIPPMVVGKYLDHSGVQPPSISGGESQDTIEERLKGLGYL